MDDQLQIERCHNCSSVNLRVVAQMSAESWDSAALKALLGPKNAAALKLVLLSCVRCFQVQCAAGLRLPRSGLTGSQLESFLGRIWAAIPAPASIFYWFMPFSKRLQVV